MSSADVGNLGRQWAIQELRERSWEDLHGLWHVCVRERNRIATSDFERERIQAGYGGFESQERDRVVSFSPAVYAVTFIYMSWNAAWRLFLPCFRGNCQLAIEIV